MLAQSCIPGTISKYQNLQCQMWPEKPITMLGRSGIHCCHGNKSVKLALWSTVSKNHSIISDKNKLAEISVFMLFHKNFLVE